MIRFRYHAPSTWHWTDLGEIGRVATRLAHRAGWRYSHAKCDQATPYLCSTHSTGSKQRHQLFGESAPGRAGDVQHPACSRIGPRPAFGSRCGKTSWQVHIHCLPASRAAQDSVSGDRRLTVLRSIGAGVVAFEEGANSCHGGATTEDGLKNEYALVEDMFTEDLRNNLHQSVAKKWTGGVNRDRT